LDLDQLNDCERQIEHCEHAHIELRSKWVVSGSWTWKPLTKSIQKVPRRRALAQHVDIMTLEEFRSAGRSPSPLRYLQCINTVGLQFSNIHESHQTTSTQYELTCWHKRYRKQTILNCILFTIRKTKTRSSKIQPYHSSFFAPQHTHTVRS